MSLTLQGLQDTLRNSGISDSSRFTLSMNGDKVEAKKVGFLHSSGDMLRCLFIIPYSLFIIPYSSFIIHYSSLIT